MPNIHTSMTYERPILGMNFDRHTSRMYSSRYPVSLMMMEDETTHIKLIKVLRETRVKEPSPRQLGMFRPCFGLSIDAKNDYSEDALFGVDCDEVYPNIFIGNGTTAKNKAYLRKIGVTHVLNTAEGKTCGMVDTNQYFYRDTPIKYLGFRLIDLPGENITSYFNEAANFIDDGVTSNGKVYVHCLMGMSRSSTCVIAYLMLKKGFSAADALRIVRERRGIHPNEGFLQQLADLDNKLRKERERVCYLH